MCWSEVSQLDEKCRSIECTDCCTFRDSID